MELPGISAVIAARNEEAQIVDCLNSVIAWCREIIVVDDYSTDETASLAEASGARVVKLSEKGFPRSGVEPRVENVFKLGFQEARYSYILRLDADERPSPQLMDLFDHVVKEGEVAAVKVARRYYFFGDWLREGGWFKPEQVALIRRDAWDRKWPSEIHEQVAVRGEILVVQPTEILSIAHYDYENVQEFAERSLVSYAKQDGKERASGVPGVYRPSLLWRPLKRGLGRYVLRRGYRDGTRGAVVAALLAAYELCSECYAWNETRLRDKRGPRSG